MAPAQYLVVDTFRPVLEMVVVADLFIRSALVPEADWQPHNGRTSGLMSIKEGRITAGQTHCKGVTVFFTRLWCHCPVHCFVSTPNHKVFANDVLSVEKRCLLSSFLTSWTLSAVDIDLASPFWGKLASWYLPYFPLLLRLTVLAIKTFWDRSLKRLQICITISSYLIRCGYG